MKSSSPSFVGRNMKKEDSTMNICCRLSVEYFQFEYKSMNVGVWLSHQPNEDSHATNSKVSDTKPTHLRIIAAAH